MKRLEPLGKVHVGNIGTAQIELGLARVKRAVTDEDQPEGLTAGRRMLGERRAQAIVIGHALFGVDPDQLERG